MVTEVRQALAPGRFGQVFATGARLTQQEAVAAARNQPASTSPTVEPGKWRAVRWPARGAPTHRGRQRIRCPCCLAT